MHDFPPVVLQHIFEVCTCVLLFVFFLLLLFLWVGFRVYVTQYDVIFELNNSLWKCSSGLVLS